MLISAENNLCRSTITKHFIHTTIHLTLYQSVVLSHGLALESYLPIETFLGSQILRGRLIKHDRLCTYLVWRYNVNSNHNDHNDDGLAASTVLLHELLSMGYLWFVIELDRYEAESFWQFNGPENPGSMRECNRSQQFTFCKAFYEARFRVILCFCLWAVDVRQDFIGETVRCCMHSTTVQKKTSVSKSMYLINLKSSFWKLQTSSNNEGFFNLALYSGKMHRGCFIPVFP